MKVQIVTCLGIPAFELNSGRVLVQVKKKKVSLYHELCKSQVSGLSYQQQVF